MNLERIFEKVLSESSDFKNDEEQEYKKIIVENMKILVHHWCGKGIGRLRMESWLENLIPEAFDHIQFEYNSDNYDLDEPKICYEPVTYKPRKSGRPEKVKED